ncbi:hypothetical protein ACFTY8_46705 [Streptomyces mirabilis]|uniref:hypothetical protein n=1 Tax=Streptomyces mirabilis TaxID=68239 RepID=UPI003638D2B7
MPPDLLTGVQTSLELDLWLGCSRYENVAIVPADPIPEHVKNGQFEISGTVKTGADERERCRRCWKAPPPVFENIPEPDSPPAVVAAPQGAPTFTPQQLLAHVYEADDWEDFTVEWVRALGLWNGWPLVGRGISKSR